MKKEARLLKEKAINSLVLSIEHFNRPSDRGRIEAVLIFLDHSFEMLLKSVILHRGGKIREPREKQTIGFDKCIRKALSEFKAITEEQALTLQTINGHRDAAHHYLLDISEQLLYLQAQAGLTLFRDIYKSAFGEELKTELPERVLPLSTTPPLDMTTLFDREVDAVRQLLVPGSRRRTEAAAKLRALAIMESSIAGEKTQPTSAELGKLANEVKGGKSWHEIFPGIASINITANGYGPSLDLRITKKEGMPVHVVPEGTPNAAVVAFKRVNELDFYSMGRDKLAENLGLTGPKTTAMIRYLTLQSDTECFKRVIVGNAHFDRYSQKALEKIKEAFNKVTMENVWKTHGIRRVPLARR